jgi:hypothetical protein
LCRWYVSQKYTPFAFEKHLARVVVADELFEVEPVRGIRLLKPLFAIRWPSRVWFHDPLVILTQRRPPKAHLSHTLDQPDEEPQLVIDGALYFGTDTLILVGARGRGNRASHISVSRILGAPRA